MSKAGVFSGGYYDHAQLYQSPDQLRALAPGLLRIDA
jgi:hypothetical protein